MILQGEQSGAQGMMLSNERLQSSFHMMNVLIAANDQEKDGVEPSLQMANEPIYMVNRIGEKVDIDLHVRDIVNSSIEKGLQIKYPICFECYDRILNNFGEIIEGQSKSMNVYAEQLLMIEKDIAQAKAAR